MHLYCLTRGTKFFVDRFINDLQAQYFEHTQNGVKGYLSLGVRPIQFWEIAFPSSSRDEVLKTIFTNPNNPTGESNWNPNHKKYLEIMRMGLRLKKIPDTYKDPKIPRRLVFNQDIEVAGIGIKEDEIMKDGTEKI